jgi:hypothetical protein
MSIDFLLLCSSENDLLTIQIQVQLSNNSNCESHFFRKLITACKSQDTLDINCNYDASNRPAARPPTGGATVHGVSDNAAAIDIAEIARENTRHSIIIWGAGGREHTRIIQPLYSDRLECLRRNQGIF